MNIVISTIIAPLVSAFLFSALITQLIIPLLKKFNIVDDPKIHKHPGMIHEKPIPRGGGLPLFLGVLIPGIFLLPHTGVTLGIFIAAGIMLIIGLLDDFSNSHGKDISPFIRLCLNIISAIIIVVMGISIHFITNPFGGILHLDNLYLPKTIIPFSLVLSDIISILWLIWVTNMINWSKGVDGQMPGIVAIAAIIIGIVGLRLTPTGSIDTALSFLIAGSAIGFLIFNFYPAKIFPGFGATSLYLLLGVASILSSAKLATAILVLGVPAVDAAFSITRRLLAKKSPLKGDKKHLHHILLRLGLNQRQIALFYWALSAILGVLSLGLENKSKVFAIVTLVVLTAGILLFLHRITRKNNEDIIA